MIGKAGWLVLPLCLYYRLAHLWSVVFVEESLEKFVDVIYPSYVVVSKCRSRGWEANRFPSVFMLVSFLQQSWACDTWLCMKLVYLLELTTVRS